MHAALPPPACVSACAAVCPSCVSDLRAREGREIPLKEIRDSLGGSSVSDEEFLLRYIMKGEREIKAMRAAGPRKQY